MPKHQVTAIIKSLEKLTEKVVTKITLDVTANLISSTPVDTNWARANWVPTIGKPFEADLSSIKPSAQSAASARSKQRSAMGVVLGYKLPMGSVFVSNNVPYIGKLNDGSSKQEPAGFVQRAVRKAVTQDIGSLGT